MYVLRSICAIASVLTFMALSACSGGGGGESGTIPPEPQAMLRADAGQDQSVFVGRFVTLDGSKSTNANQTGLTYAWTLAKPTGSNATLSNPTSVNPAMTVDVEGVYEATLIVSDARQTILSSEPDRVVVTAARTDLPPTADAGANKNEFVGRPVTLDGSGSRASGNKQLAFNWSFKERPTGSNATLSDTTARTPSFTPDRSGPYIFQLIVNDGTKSSTPAEVTITAAVKPRPTANAGPNQAARPGTLVILDGSTSSSATGDPLSRFSWSLTVPQGSTATLAKADTKSPTFTPDVVGAYVAQLIVNDGTDDSAPATVQVTVSTELPVANAGANQDNAGVCRNVTLDGSASKKRDGVTQPNSYTWTLPLRPTDSKAQLDNGAAVSPSFLADVAGTYIANLVVTEVDTQGALLNSPAASVTIKAKSTHIPGTRLPDDYTNKCDSCHKLGSDDSSGARSDLARKAYFRVKEVLEGQDAAVKQQQDHQGFRFNNDIEFLCNLFQAY